MPKPLFRIGALTATLFLLLTTGKSGAVVLDWNTVTWTAGTTDNSYNVDGVAGNDIRVQVVKNGVTTSNSFGFPTNVATPAIGNSNLVNQPTGVTALQIATAGMVNSTNNITVTISFIGTYAVGVRNASFNLYDIDAAATGNPSFIDRISLSALNGGTAVPLTATYAGVTNPASFTITNSGTTAPILQGVTATGNISTDQGNASVTTGAATVTSIRFVWNNPGPNFQTQLIELGNINFTAIPEVASSSGALMLCTGLLAFRRRRCGRLAA
jgi:hypothetical protein